MTCIAIKYIHVDANIIVFVGNCWTSAICILWLSFGFSHMQCVW
jgi:hypothetical protein